MEGDAGEVEIAEGVVICRWHLFGVAVDVGEVFATCERFTIYIWFTNDSEVGDASAAER